MSLDFTTLDTLDLPPDLQWIDEFADTADLVGQEETVTITGALIVQASAQQAGRPVTLQGRLEGNVGFAPVTREVFEQLRALAAVPGAVYELTLCDGRTFDVMFRRPGLSATPIKNIAPYEDGDYVFPTLNLMMV